MFSIIMEIVLLFNLEPSVIIDFIDSLLSKVFNVAQEPELKEWGNEVISGLVKDTENQVTNQLGYNPTD
jgi:hypothetical protein